MELSLSRSGLFGPLVHAKLHSIGARMGVGLSDPQNWKFTKLLVRHALERQTCVHYLSQKALK